MFSVKRASLSSGNESESSCPFPWKQCRERKEQEKGRNMFFWVGSNQRYQSNFWRRILFWTPQVINWHCGIHVNIHMWLLIYPIASNKACTVYMLCPCKNVWETILYNITHRIFLLLIFLAALSEIWLNSFQDNSKAINFVQPAQ